ncbi:MAG: hypothetical protein HY226_01525 [Candidatus Vogelbacteria bacterium]|nr:hypothetical protein [Candidatus Vogelbacteria bacterium]
MDEIKRVRHKPVFVMVDVEASGGNMHRHSLLSWAACVVTEEEISKDELRAKGFLYYDEIKPLDIRLTGGENSKILSSSGREFDWKAMQVGCRGLRCLEKFKGIPEYNTWSPLFDPAKVLEELEKSGTPVYEATITFEKWLQQFNNEQDATFLVVGCDTQFFDGPLIKNYFDLFIGDRKHALCHSGENIKSRWAGVLRRVIARKKSFGIKDDRAVKHCAEDDAIHLAKLAREAIYKNCR